jgi:hypothetical protein
MYTKVGLELKILMAQPPFLLLIVSVLAFLVERHFKFSFK